MMVLNNMGNTAQETKDNLGTRDTTKDQVLFRNRESIYVEEDSSIEEKQLVGSAFVLGHPVNGILGTSAFGAGTLGSWTVHAVVNPNNIFREHFRDNFFYNSSDSSGVSWDTTNFRIEFIKDGKVVTKSIFYDYKEIANAKLVIDFSGLKVSSQIDVINFPGGREVNLT